MPSNSSKNLFIEDGNSSIKKIRDLPIELRLMILEKLPFEKVVGIDYMVDKKLYDKDKYTWNWAAENGHFEVLKWLHENRTEGCTTNAMDWTARRGDLEVLKWLHENRTEGCTTNAIDQEAG